MAAPVSKKVDLHKDYEYYIAKYGSQPPPPPPPNPPKRNSSGVRPLQPVMELGTPPRPPTKDDIGDEEGNVDGDEALLDLAQLEELHNEAERMKALGNKHMAAQVNHI